MALIDEQGRLFGLVNIIDALVVLLIAAVVFAGVAAVLQGPQVADSSGDTEPRYATISFGRQPAAIAQTIATGDRVRFTDDGTGNSATKTVNVTDVYRAPGSNGQVFVVARVAMTGHLQNGSVVVGGKSVRVGQVATIVGDTYKLDGTIVALNRLGEQLPIGQTSIVVEATVPTAIANTIHEGDAYRVGNISGGTIESVTVFPTSDPNERRVHLGVQLWTLSTGAGPQFVDHTLYVGQNLTLTAGEATLQGMVVARGTTTLPGERVEASVLVAWHHVAPVVADAVTVGTIEQLRGISARVVDKRVTPESVIVSSDNGTLHIRDHPRRQNITLRVDLTARRTDDGLLFHGRRLQLDQNIILDFGAVTVQGQVIEIDTKS